MFGVRCSQVKRSWLPLINSSTPKLLNSRLVQPIGNFNWGGVEFYHGRFQSGASGREADAAGPERGANSDAGNTAFISEPQIIYRIRFAAVVTAAPDCRAFKFEIDARLVRGASAPLRVDDFDVKERHVRAVGLKAVWSNMRGQLQ